MSIGALKNITEAKKKAKVRANIVLNEKIWKATKKLAVDDDDIESASEYIEDLIIRDFKKKGIKLS